jgi:hypothetical protein
VPDPLTPGDGQDLLARFKAAREARDVDAMLELFGEPAEMRVDPFAPALEDSNAIREHWNGIAARQVDIEHDPERIWVAGRTVLSSWHEGYTLRETAERIRVRGFSTLELDPRGLVRRMRSWPLEQVVGRHMEAQDG